MSSRAASVIDLDLGWPESETELLELLKSIPGDEIEAIHRMVYSPELRREVLCEDLALHLSGNGAPAQDRKAALEASKALALEIYKRAEEEEGGER